MTTWDAVPGETPPDLSGLRHREDGASRATLAKAEALNINKAFLKYLAVKPDARSAPFDYDWSLTLHQEMFGDVWEWAGCVRSSDRNLGVPHHQVRDQLYALLEDLRSWTGFGHAIEDQAVWLHHKAVQIHPFQNGNGRWARLLSAIWLKRADHAIVAWPDTSLGHSGTLRDEYLSALRAADEGRYAPLADLHRRFQQVSS